MVDTKDYNKATKFFRDMEAADPYDMRWGKFADAMDEMISTAVLAVRCMDCKWRNTNACFCKSPKDVRDDWFCSEGEAKE